MENNNTATNRDLSIRLTPEQINDLLLKKFNLERGARAKYARRIRRHRSTVTRLIDGQIRGDLRKRFAKFLGVPESMLPRKVG